MIMRKASEDISQNAIFNAWIKWGHCSDTISINDLPEAFREAKRIWDWIEKEHRILSKLYDTNSSLFDKKYAEYHKQLNVAYELLTPFVSCSFDRENIYQDISSILNLDCSHIKANKIEVFAYNYSMGNLPCFPSIRANAEFILPTARVLTDDIVSDWEIAKDTLLMYGVSFSWNIPDVDEWFLMEVPFDGWGLDFIRMV
jgi:hypothetical protein